MLSVKRMDYIVNDATEEMKKSLQEAETLAELWGAITYPTKKNGEPYAVLSKNFANCRVGLSRIAIYDFEKAIEVHGRTASGHYIYDSLNCYYAMGGYSKYPRAEAHPERVTKPSPYLVPFYVLSLDEIKEDIATRKAYWESVVADKKDALIKVEKGIREVLTAVSDTMSKCEAENGATVAGVVKQLLKNEIIFI